MSLVSWNHEDTAFLKLRSAHHLDNLGLVYSFAIQTLGGLGRGIFCRLLLALTNCQHSLRFICAAIVAALDKLQSSKSAYFTPFQRLVELLELKIQETEERLETLKSLEAPCKALGGADLTVSL